MVVSFHRMVVFTLLQYFPASSNELAADHDWAQIGASQYITFHTMQYVIQCNATQYDPKKVKVLQKVTKQ